MAKVKLFLTLNKREKERGCETPLWSCESPDSVTYANRFFSFLFSFLFFKKKDNYCLLIKSLKLKLSGTVIKGAPDILAN